MTIHPTPEQLHALALVAFDGDAEHVSAWLIQPSERLGGQRPEDLLSTEEGARLVEQTFIAILHGLPV